MKPKIEWESAWKGKKNGHEEKGSCQVWFAHSKGSLTIV